VSTALSLADDLAANFGKDAVTAKSKAWQRIARPEQLPPKGDWLVWLILAGRGFGKTRSGAEWAADMARKYPGCRVALVAATVADGRDTMVEGESGMLAVLDDRELLGGSRDKAWNRSMGELKLANGSQFKVYSSEKPDRLRGPQHHFAWGDEAAAWEDANKGTAAESTWSMLVMTMRLKALPGWPAGYRTRVVVTTTPKPVTLLRVPEHVLARDASKAGIWQQATTTTTGGRTHDNLANLSETFKAAVIDRLEGTTLGRQELDAQILQDVEGAMLNREQIDACRVLPGEVLHRGIRVVSIDPAVTEHDNSDETGIVVVGYAGSDLGESHGYVLADLSLRGSPDTWARVAWGAALEHNACALIVEDNQGGDMVEHLLRTTRDMIIREEGRRGVRRLYWPLLERIHPSGRGAGKWARATPIRGLYEQGKIHHVTNPDNPAHLDQLEEQLTTWTGDPRQKSPDRIDALVHGLTWLMLPSERKSKSGNVTNMAGRRAAAGRR
jgi:phage terminase large subunit-like protein